MGFSTRKTEFIEELGKVEAADLSDAHRELVTQLRELLPGLVSCSVKNTNYGNVRGMLAQLGGNPDGAWGAAESRVASLGIPKLTESFEAAWDAAMSNASVENANHGDVDGFLLQAGSIDNIHYHGK